jgi:hypothetical protein
LTSSPEEELGAGLSKMQYAVVGEASKHKQPARVSERGDVCVVVHPSFVKRDEMRGGYVVQEGRQYGGKFMRVWL